MKLPLERIQGIILRGYGHLTEACFCLLGVDTARAGDARRWLAALPVTDAQRAAKKQAEPGPFVNVALTHAGLVALGLPQPLLDGFPREIVEGPDTDARARALGDSGPSHPTEWAWGSRRREPVHVVLMLYAADAVALAAAHGKHLTDARAAGLHEVKTLDTIALAGRKEHFGFRDGIAQPVVEGARDEVVPGNTIKPGEVLLGYPTEFEGEDSHVPAAPDFDFCKDGSYLVMRQLEQDVRAFWSFCRDGTRTVRTAGAAIKLAAQMVGRWPSGASLVRYPHADPHPGGNTDDDAFGYRAPIDDTSGLHCPYGSHVRRSNPRDWNLSDDPGKARVIANRHRILRRGRAYGTPLTPDAQPASYLGALDAPPEGVQRGLHFLCFGASVERQFEFVQQQWCNNPKFARLANGADPLIGDQRPLAGTPPSFTVQASPVSRRVLGLQRFVTVKGAAYCFVPSLSALRGL